MKFYHAAALALVGWYLMLPPWSAQNKDVDMSAPLNLWIYDGAYDTAAECSQAQNGTFKELLPYSSDKTPLGQAFKQIGSAQCIASDDPRLTDK